MLRWISADCVALRSLLKADMRFPSATLPPRHSGACCVSRDALVPTKKLCLKRLGPPSGGCDRQSTPFVQHSGCVRRDGPGTAFYVLHFGQRSCGFGHVHPWYLVSHAIFFCSVASAILRGGNPVSQHPQSTFRGLLSPVASPQTITAHLYQTSVILNVAINTVASLGHYAESIVVTG